LKEMRVLLELAQNRNEDGVANGIGEEIDEEVRFVAGPEPADGANVEQHVDGEFNFSVHKVHQVSTKESHLSANAEGKHMREVTQSTVTVSIVL
jgi:hypothetical protein